MLLNVSSASACVLQSGCHSSALARNAALMRVTLTPLAASVLVAAIPSVASASWSSCAPARKPGVPWPLSCPLAPWRRLLLLLLNLRGSKPYQSNGHAVHAVSQPQRRQQKLSCCWSADAPATSDDDDDDDAVVFAVGDDNEAFGVDVLCVRVLEANEQEQKQKHLLLRAVASRARRLLLLGPRCRCCCCHRRRNNNTCALVRISATASVCVCVSAKCRFREQT